MSIADTGKNPSEGVAKAYWNSHSGYMAGQKVYHELEESPLIEIDLVEQLRGNLARLGDLQGRMSYMMGEIGQLTKSIK